VTATSCSKDRIRSNSWKSAAYRIWTNRQEV